MEEDSVSVGQDEAVVEELKKTGHRTATSALHYIRPGDVACDVCTGRKLKAVKSCLVCQVSYCETHLQPHYESPAFKKHKLVQATGHLQEKICSHHDKLLEVYCRTDQRCICYLCTMDEHKGHDIVSAAEERDEKQKQLGSIERQSEQRIQERKEELQDLRRILESLTRSAQTAVEDSERIFTQFMRRRRSEVKELIRDKEKALLSEGEGLLERLEQEIADLRRRDAELEQLSHTEDHIHFLQVVQSVCAPPGPEDLPSITVNRHFTFEEVKKSLSELREGLEEVYNQEILKLSGKVSEVRTVLPLDPRTREEFLQYSCKLTVDNNTINKNVSVTGETVGVPGIAQSYPDHTERFDSHPQVLCRKGLSGCSYWEAQWSGQDGVEIAVSYKEISRKGEGDSALGRNAKSWSLFCCPSSYSFWHNNESTEIPMPSSSRIGVYLDHRAGTLSFYSISDTMTLLHRVQTTFTQPLYPGFSVRYQNYWQSGNVYLRGSSLVLNFV